MAKDKNKVEGRCVEWSTMDETVGPAPVDAVSLMRRLDALEQATAPVSLDATRDLRYHVQYPRAETRYYIGWDRYETISAWTLRGLRRKVQRRLQQEQAREVTIRSCRRV